MGTEDSVSETICPDCGERNAGRVEFCASCGAFLAWDGEEGAAEPEPPRSAPPPAAAPAARASAPAGPGPAGHQASAHPAATAASPRTEPQYRPGQPVPPPPQGVAAPVARAWNAAAPALGALPLSAQMPGPSTGTYRQQPPPQPVYDQPVEPPPPTEGPCPRCSVVNDADLRFCRKCGQALRGPVLQDGGTFRPQPPPERVPWWRRWLRPGDNTRRAARAAYRHSLPVRYRLIRYGLALLGVGAIVGALTFIGQNPVGWVTNQINNLRGSLVQIDGLQAYTEPEVTGAPSTAPTSDSAPGSTTGATTGAGPSTGGAPTSGAAQSNSAVPTTPAPPTSAAPAVDTAENALDNLADTAWTTAWSAADQLNPADAPCVSPSTASAAGAPGSLLIVPSGAVTVREVAIAGGLAKADSRRMQQWRPKTVQLAFSDGTCQQITLTDTDGLQQLKIDPVSTTQLRLSVVDAYPPVPDQPIDQLAVTDLRLFQRP